MELNNATKHACNVKSDNRFFQQRYEGTIVNMYNIPKHREEIATNKTAKIKQSAIIAVY